MTHLHKLEVNVLEPVAGRRDEVKARMDACVLYRVAVALQLLVHKELVLLVHVPRNTVNPATLHQRKSYLGFLKQANSTQLPNFCTHYYKGLNYAGLPCNIAWRMAKTVSPCLIPTNENR
jgi:hypothetical protein